MDTSNSRHDFVLQYRESADIENIENIVENFNYLTPVIMRLVFYV